MTEPPPSPPKRATPPAFLRGFNVEDLILHVFSLLTLVVFCDLLLPAPRHYRAAGAGGGILAGAAGNA